ncbi:hypothetical protein [Puia sp.]|uniref:hypothetical protein n=1 Tax=Puia sp. TaxID=2045100 RepID=UPI002F405313
MQSLHDMTGNMPSSEFPGINPSSGSSLSCPICGQALYATDKGNCEVTYHCSSAEARFWDFDRGTVAQHKAKEHWDRSIREVFLSRG